MVAGGITRSAKWVPIPIYYNLEYRIGGLHMKLLSVYDVMEFTGLNYRNALLLVKAANHIQINNRYYISEESLRAFLRQDAPILIQEDGK